MKTTIGQTKINTNKKQRRESTEIKNLRNKKKEIRKKLKQAQKNNEPNIEIMKETSKGIQIQLKQAIEKREKQNIQEKINKLVKEGGSKSQTFWKMRKNIIGKGIDIEQDPITENNTKLTNEREAKEYIAEYYENLYRARDGTPEYKQWTDKITNKVKSIETTMTSIAKNKSITEKEFDNVNKSIKRGKSSGPDTIPNELFKEAKGRSKEILIQIMNNVIENKEIPEQWQNGEIIRFYKGKGKRGKCSNERGITLSSNFGKFLERIVNNRAAEKVKITDAQAGGMKKRATTDHIMTLNQLIHINKSNKKPTYMAFLDVTKAYDKAWLDAILYVLYKNGITDNTWHIIKKLNENLTAEIRTKYGKTRKIQIKDSIRQGGVLSVMMYALLMDEINKEIEQKNIGVEIPPNGHKIGCLLWMDDVVLITNNDKEMTELLKITNDIAKRYHIEFGKEKSKIVKIGKKGEKTKMNLGDMELEYVDKYKYLGNIINSNNNLKDHIEEIRKKTEGAYQIILNIAQDAKFKNINMEYIWKLVETCIEPIITYGAENWKPLKKEIKSINKIWEGIIKRILMVPITTPKEALYIETGLPDIETMIDKKQLNMHKRLTTWAPEMVKEVINDTTKGGWKDRVENKITQYQIAWQENDTKQQAKTKIKQQTILYQKNRMIIESNEKSKVKHLLEGMESWRPGKRSKYLNILKRHEASILFKARTRMLEIKQNYKQKYKDNMTCRACKTEEETQTHILEECTTIHVNTRTKVTKTDIFTENIGKLRGTAKKISNIMEKLVQLPSQ